MPNIISAFKYKISYEGPFEIMQCWTNVTIILKYGTIKTRYNISHINLYTYDTNVEEIIDEMMYDDDRI